MEEVSILWSVMRTARNDSSETCLLVLWLPIALVVANLDKMFGRGRGRDIETAVIVADGHEIASSTKAGRAKDIIVSKVKSHSSTPSKKTSSAYKSPAII